MSTIDFNSTADFEKALVYCLDNEGQFVDKPEDRGGATNKGITIGILQKYRGRAVTVNELKNLSYPDIRDIYDKFFWTPLKISGLKQPIATAILDTAINQGQSSAIKMAQQVIGIKVVPDGIMGPDTLKCLDEIDPKIFILGYIKEIQNKFVRICINANNQIIFLSGWLERSRRLFTLI